MFNYITSWPEASQSYILLMFLLPGTLFLHTFIAQINLQIFWEDYLTNHVVTKHVLSDNISFIVVLTVKLWYLGLYLKLQYMPSISTPYPNKIHLK